MKKNENLIKEFDIEVLEKREGLKIACLEDIALNNNWISLEHLEQIAKPMSKNGYGQYLIKCVKEKKTKF